MRHDTRALKCTLRRLTLLLGVAQVTVGCVVGLLPPTAVPWFRGIVMAHVEYTGNGVLLVALALVLPDMRLGRAALWIWFGSLQLGTWLNGSAALVAGLGGRSSRLLTVANAASAPPRGAGDPVVTGMLVATGAAVLVGLALTLAGLARAWGTEPQLADAVAPPAPAPVW
jgi:hypothetical protein